MAIRSFKASFRHEKWTRWIGYRSCRKPLYMLGILASSGCLQTEDSAISSFENLVEDMELDYHSRFLTLIFLNLSNDPDKESISRIDQSLRKSMNCIPNTYATPYLIFMMCSYMQLAGYNSPPNTVV